MIKSLDQLNINQPNENALKKYPLPQHQHASAIVKFYNDLGESLRVGQLVEVIGIRGNDVPKNSGDEEEAMLGYGSVLDALAGVPVLHAIAYQNVEADQRLDLQIQNDKSAEDVRKELIEYISSSLNGDVLTAEFILLQLVSRVYVCITYSNSH